MPKPNRHIHRVVAVALAAVFVCLATGSQLASSANLHTNFVPATPPVLDPTYEPQITQLASGGSGITSASVPSILEPQWQWEDILPEAQATGRFPYLAGALGEIVLGATAFDIGLKIGGLINTEWLHLGGSAIDLYSSSASGSQDLSAEHWVPYGQACNSVAGTGLGTHVSYPVSGTNYQDDIFCMYNTSNGSGAGDCNSAQSGGNSYFVVAMFGGTWNGSQPANYVNCLTSVQTEFNNETTICGSNCLTETVDSTLCGTLTTQSWSTYYTGDTCKALIMPGESTTTPGTGIFSLIKSSLVTYTSQTVTATCTMGGTCGSLSTTAPGASMSGANLSALRTWLNSGSGDVSLPQQVNCQLLPTSYVCPSGPGTGDGATVTTPLTTSPAFTLPMPSPQETYVTYTERLRTLGYLGTVTITNDAMSEYPSASYGARLLPTSLTSIQVGTGTITYLYDQTTGAQVAWPTNPATVTPGVTTLVTLLRVPDGYDPTAHGATPSTVTGAGAAVAVPNACNCPPINLSPFESLSVGSKFPFGVFSWLNTTLGSIPSSGTAMTFSVGYPGGGGTVVVNTASTAWETTYRPIVFPIVEFLMTLGMFWFFATKILGLGGGE